LGVLKFWGQVGEEVGVDFVADFAGEEGEEGAGVGWVLCLHFEKIRDSRLGRERWLSPEMPV